MSFDKINYKGKEVLPPLEEMTTGVAYFQHIYRMGGFSISGKFTEDGKDYEPPKTHVCLQSGYLCSKQLKEEPIKIISYIYTKFYRLYRKLRPYDYLRDREAG
jgi:hypothetical protein